MSDTFNEKIKDYYISTILDHCSYFKQHTFQVLTKRSERLKDFNAFYYKNIWLGVSVELAKYKNRIDNLRQTNAKVKFLSCEPWLGDLGELDLTGINWVIVGGESGPNARPMHPDWVRNIQKQCQEQNVPFFFKQWGEWIPETEAKNYVAMYYSDVHRDTVNFNGHLTGKNEDCLVYKVGKKKAGSLLDGKEYKEMPE
jgi:protein gp37